MKPLVILVLQTAFCHYALAQWQKIVLRTDITVADAFTDASFINRDTGFITTASGVIYKTTDGGLHWAYDTINRGGGIFQIQFTTPDTGYMTVTAGFYGSTILKSINGGNTWFDVGQGNNLTEAHGMCFLNSDTGMLGAAGRIFRTVDGGQSWTSTSLLDIGGSIEDVHFINNTTGYAFYRCLPSNNSEQASIAITTDGGTTWVPQFFCNDGPPDVITSDHYAALINDSVFLGFGLSARLIKCNIYANNHLLHPQYIFSGDSAVSVTHNYNFLPPNDNPHNIRFYNSRLGMVAYWNAIIRTEDGGVSWIVTDFPFTSDFDSNEANPSLKFIVPITSDKWLVMGNSGRIYMTENRGGVWSNINESASNNSLIIYPNPADSKLICNITSVAKNAIVQIFSLDGHLLLQNNNITTNHFEVDISALPSGMYFLSLQDEKDRLVKRFIKE